MDDTLRSELIKLLNECKREHYTDYAGINDCEYEWSGGTEDCNCGANELNAKIETMIKGLKD